MTMINSATLDAFKDEPMNSLQTDFTCHSLSNMADAQQSAGQNKLRLTHKKVLYDPYTATYGSTTYHREKVQGIMYITNDNAL